MSNQVNSGSTVNNGPAKWTDSFTGLQNSDAYVYSTQRIYYLDDIESESNKNPGFSGSMEDLYLQRAQSLQFPAPVEPTITLREFIQSILQSFSEILKTKGFSRLADIALLQFNIDSLFRLAEIKAQAIRASAVEQIESSNRYNRLMSGQSILLPEGEYFSTDDTSQFMSKLDKNYVLSVLNKIAPSGLNYVAKDLVRSYLFELTSSKDDFLSSLSEASNLIAPDNVISLINNLVNTPGNLLQNNVDWMTHFQTVTLCSDAVLDNLADQCENLRSSLNSVSDLNGLNIGSASSPIKFKEAYTAFLNSASKSYLELDPSVSMSGYSTWNNTNNYKMGDLVKKDISLYMCLSNTSGDDPVYSDKWSCVGFLPGSTYLMNKLGDNLVGRLYNMGNNSSSVTDEELKLFLDDTLFYEGLIRSRAWINYTCNAVWDSTNLVSVTSLLGSLQDCFNYNAGKITNIINGTTPDFVTVSNIVLQMWNLIAPKYTNVSDVPQDCAMKSMLYILQAIKDAADKHDAAQIMKIVNYGGYDASGSPSLVDFVTSMNISFSVASANFSRKLDSELDASGMADYTPFGAPVLDCFRVEDIRLKMQNNQPISIFDDGSNAKTYDNILFANLYFRIKNLIQSIYDSQPGRVGGGVFLTEYNRNYYQGLLGGIISNYSLSCTMSVADAVNKQNLHALLLYKESLDNNSTYVDASYRDAIESALLRMSTSATAGPSGYMKQINDLLLELMNFIKSGLPRYDTFLVNWWFQDMYRRHRDGNVLTNLKSLHDRLKYALLSLCKVVDSNIAYEGDTFVGTPWCTSAQFNQGQTVIYNGNVYECVKSHVSDSTIAPPSTAFWSPSTWTANSKMYSQDSVVNYNNCLYKCIVPHTSQNSYDYTPGCVASSDIWRRLSWAPNVDYKEGNTVVTIDSTSFDTVVYRCIKDHTSSGSGGILGVPSQVSDRSLWMKDTSLSLSHNIQPLGAVSSLNNIDSRANLIWSGQRSTLTVNTDNNGYWEAPSGVSGSGYRVKPLSNRPSKAWMRPQTNNWWPLIGGNTVGDSIGKDFSSISFMHQSSAGAAVILSLLQYLEMFFFSASQFFIPVANAYYVATPAQMVAYGCPVGGLSPNMAYSSVDYHMYWDTLDGSSPDPSYLGAPQVLHRISPTAFSHMDNFNASQALIVNIYDHITNFSKHMNKYTIAVSSEARRVFNKAVLANKAFMSGLLQLVAPSLDAVSPEERKLLVKMLAIVLAIVISVLSGNKDIASAVTRDADGNISFKDELLDIITISVADANVIVAKASEMAMQVLSSIGRSGSVVDESVDSNLTRDMMVSSVVSAKNELALVDYDEEVNKFN